MLEGQDVVPPSLTVLIAQSRCSPRAVYRFTKAHPLHFRFSATSFDPVSPTIVGGRGLGETVGGLSGSEWGNVVRYGWPFPRDQ